MGTLTFFLSGENFYFQTLQEIMSSDNVPGSPIASASRRVKKLPKKNLECKDKNNEKNPSLERLKKLDLKAPKKLDFRRHSLAASSTLLGKKSAVLFSPTYHAGAQEAPGLPRQSSMRKNIRTKQRAKSVFVTSPGAKTKSLSQYRTHLRALPKMTMKVQKIRTIKIRTIKIRTIKIRTIKKQMMKLLKTQMKRKNRMNNKLRNNKLRNRMNNRLKKRTTKSTMRRTITAMRMKVTFMKNLIRLFSSNNWDHYPSK